MNFQENSISNVYICIFAKCQAFIAKGVILHEKSLSSPDSSQRGLTVEAYLLAALPTTGSIPSVLKMDLSGISQHNTLYITLKKISVEELISNPTAILHSFSSLREVQFTAAVIYIKQDVCIPGSQTQKKIMVNTNSPFPLWLWKKINPNALKHSLCVIN